MSAQRAAEGGFWWTGAGRALAWLTFRGRGWTAVVAAAAVLMWVGNGAMRGAAMRAQGVRTTVSSHGFMVHWDVASQRLMSSQAASIARRDGGEVLMLQVNVVAETGTEWWGGAPVGRSGRVWYEVQPQEAAAKVDEPALLREVRWADTVDRMLVGAGLASFGKLRAAAARGPGSVTEWKRVWVARAVGGRALLWGSRLGLVWVLLAVGAEAMRGSAGASLRARGLCWKCGYVLGVDGADRCPECGARVEGYAAQQ